MPTTLTLLGLSPPPALDGHDLLPSLTGEATASPRSSVLGQRAAFPGMEPLLFERRGDLKWIGDPEGPAHAYRLTFDPLETSPQETNHTLRHAHTARPPQRIRGKIDQEARQALEALGYAESLPSD